MNAIRILGLDPGLRRTGWGVIAVEGSRLTWVAHGVITSADKAPLAERGYNLVALSYDPPEVLTGFTAKQQIPYSFLSDQGSKTIDAFRLRDPQYKPDSFAFGVPMPAIFVISPRGVVQAKLAEEGYKTRPPVSAVLAAVDGLKR